MSFPHGTRSYAAGHVARALSRERARRARRAERKAAAYAAAEALRARYGPHLTVFAFGSVLDPDRFRLDSDVDLAVEGLPADRYYEAWRLAEAAAGGGLDLVRLESAPDWLVDEVKQTGERL